MARVIQIEVRGEAGQYEATIQRIIDKNNQLNRSAIDGARQTEAAFGNLQRVIVNLPSFFGGIASGIAAAFSIGAITAFTRSVLDAAGQIDDLSKRTGFARQTLSGIKSTIEENGGTLESFANAISKAQKSLADIEGDGKKAAAALRFMGLDVKALVQTSPEVFFEKFAEALSKVEGQNQRAAIATRVMGREGAAQIPVILELANKFQDLRQRGVSDENIKQLDKFGDALTRLKNSAIGLAQEGLANLIRGFDRLFKISDIAKAQSEVAKFGDQLHTLDVQIAALQKPGQQVSPTVAKALAELQKQRAAISATFNDAQDKLIRLEQAERTPPPTPGGGLPADDTDKINKINRAAEAINKLQTEQLKLNQTNLEAARSSGRLSDAMIAQGLTIGDLDGEIRKAALALIEHEKRAELDAAAHDKILTPALRAAIEQQAKSKIATFDQAEAVLKHKEYLELEKRALAGDEEAQKKLAEAIAGTNKNREIENQRTLDAIELTRQLGDLEADRIGILGRTNEAEHIRLENQIKYLEALKQEETLQGKNTERLRDAQILNAQTRMQQLGVASVNVGHAIADTLNDIFTAAIQGTLKFADIGKSLLAGVARTAGDFFTQILNKKLGFENIIIDNVNGLPGQIFQAFGLGAAALPGGQAGGGLFDLIFGGGRPAGVQGPLQANGQFSSGILGQLLGGGGFSLGGLAVGGGIGILSALLGGGFKSDKIGSTIGSIGGGLAGSFFGPVGSIIGSILGQLLGGLFNQIPNPSVWVKSILKFYYDALTDSFGFFNTSTITKIKDISGAKAQQVLAQHQQILQGLGDQFTDLLDVFPSQFHDIIAAQLDDANRVLNDIFGYKKYTEGGSRNIQRELDDLKNKEGPLGFFVALRGAIGTGLAATLRQSGFNFDDLIGRQFPFPPNPTPRDFPFRGGVPGLLPPEGAENVEKFITALQKFVSFTGTLSAISPRGITPFVTQADRDQLEAEIQRILETPGEGFAAAVDKMLERIKPLSEFLQQSVSEATNLFGRGLMAALEAATASQANSDFLKNIGEGVREKIFSGITEAFIASAQFTDLLAPIQQIIRQFTQDALASGQTPDINAFRQALLPAIEDISTRAESLRPLIEALQALGFDVTRALESLIGSGATGGNNVTINIENFTREDDPAALARQIQDLLNGRTSP